MYNSYRIVYADESSNLSRSTKKLLIYSDCPNGEVAICKIVYTGSSPVSESLLILSIMVSTQDFDSCNTGSIPVGSTPIVVSSLDFFSLLKGLSGVPFGLACTKAGEVPLQGTCGESDSLQVHI